MKKIALVLLVCIGFAAGVSAHSGGTNSAGCHKNHKTGDYHCH
ncbi:YHYH domain-containing protein [Vibrio sp. SCSIO 43137]